tara:strand:- start:1861 stop:2583 length:723 start_codon:yes stop_codon:yes gene_type:complete
MGNIIRNGDKTIYICNQAGCHGHFLRYLLDRFSNHTPPITRLPFNNLGNSHGRWRKSDKFKFIDVPRIKYFLRNTTGKKNIIQITIDESILYFERAFMSRARDSNTNLYDVESIRHRLIDNGSNFIEVCEKNKVSLQEGYRIAFSDLENCGARQWDLSFKKNPYLNKHDVIFFPVANFFTEYKLKTALQNLSKRFKFTLNFGGFSRIYKMFYNKNTLLKKYKQLDILQQAWVDAGNKLPD